MADLMLEIAHALERAEAAERIARMFAGLADSGEIIDIEVTRLEVGFRFSGRVKGFAIAGLLEVHEQRVGIRYSLPWAARPFRKSAEDFIVGYLSRALT